MSIRTVLNFMMRKTILTCCLIRLNDARECRTGIRGKRFMVRTFDFIFLLKRNKEDRDKIYSMMEASENIECDLGGWHLLFEQDRKTMTVTNSGTDEHLSYKFVPAEISYDSLKALIDPKDKQETELQIKYL